MAEINEEILEQVNEDSHNDELEALDDYYDSIENAISLVEEDSEFSDMFYKHYLAGDRVVYQKNITESKIFDEEWIKTLESYFPSLDRIIANPRSNIRYEEDVVAIEKARKINSQSVKHLASHTHFVKSVERNGDVVPKKILTTYAEQEYVTYENRFIKTLIDRLFIFVANRYSIIKENVLSINKNHANIKSDFGINNTEVSLNIDIVVKKNVNNKNQKINMGLLKRVEHLNKMVMSFKNSQFSKLLNNAPKVSPPIMQTNVISKNPDFRNCYLLWLFLDKYNTLAFDLDVKEKNKKLTKEIEQGYNRVAMLSYLVAESNNNNHKDNYEKEENLLKKSTKQTKKNLDDFIERPDPIEVENNEVNEYYLNQYKQLFSKSLNDFRKNASSEEVALKQAIREFNNIANTLYQSFFEIEESDDIFTKLVQEDNPEKEFEDAKKKANIAKIIREVKEVDYNNALRLEKKVAKTMQKTSNKVVRKIEAKLALEKEEKLKKDLELELDNYKKAKEQSKNKVVLLDGKKVKIMQVKKTTQEDIKQINDGVKKTISSISKEEKAKSNERIKKIKAEHTKRVEAMLAKEQAEYEKQLAKENEKLAKAKEIARQKAKEAKAKELAIAKKKEEELKKQLLAKEAEMQKAVQEANKQKLEKIKIKRNDSKYIKK